MINLTEFKTLLSKEALDRSDLELEQLKTDMYKLAGLAFGEWQKNKNLKVENTQNYQ